MDTGTRIDSKMQFLKQNLAILNPPHRFNGTGKEIELSKPPSGGLTGMAARY